MNDTRRPDWAGRLDKTWQLMDPAPAALVITTPANIYYLCGFDGSQGYLVLTSAERRLLLDGRYKDAARAAMADGALGPVSIVGVEGGVDKALSAQINGLTPGEIAFEAERLTVAGQLDWARLMPGRTWRPTFGLVEQLRLIKDATELAVMRRGCRRLSEVARHARDWLREGRTERDIAADIQYALAHAGFSRAAFPPIVASGPNSALPHARPTDRQIREGDLVVLDFGGVLDGYCGDLTRMAAVGQVQANAQGLVDAVRAAQDAALAVVRAGVLTSDVDRAAREVLSNRGFGEAFLHATGHGLGLDLHESPRIARADDPSRAVPLEDGMVITVEPGAYVAGLGGARLEDDVVVTGGRCEVLTDAPRELLTV